jgi:DNA replication protein DnaC
VLEDLAVAKQNEWRLEQLYAVINRRYEDRRPLLVTADVSHPEALGEHIGGRTCSRILEMCEPMPFLDGDHRVRATTPEDVRLVS